VEEGAGHGVILPSGGAFGCYTRKPLPVTEIHRGTIVTVDHVAATACDPPGRALTKARSENLPARRAFDSARCSHHVWRRRASAAIGKQPRMV
jgi:hypothetical protein